MTTPKAAKRTPSASSKFFTVPSSYLLPFGILRGVRQANLVSHYGWHCMKALFPVPSRSRKVPTRSVIFSGVPIDECTYRQFTPRSNKKTDSI